MFLRGFQPVTVQPKCSTNHQEFSQSQSTTWCHPKHGCHTLVQDTNHVIVRMDASAHGCMCLGSPSSGWGSVVDEVDDGPVIGGIAWGEHVPHGLHPPAATACLSVNFAHHNTLQIFQLLPRKFLYTRKSKSSHLIIASQLNRACLSFTRFLSSVL